MKNKNVSKKERYLKTITELIKTESMRPFRDFLRKGKTFNYHLGSDIEIFNYDYKSIDYKDRMRVSSVLGTMNDIYFSSLMYYTSHKNTNKILIREYWLSHLTKNSSKDFNSILKISLETLLFRSGKSTVLTKKEIKTIKKLFKICKKYIDEKVNVFFNRKYFNDNVDVGGRFKLGNNMYDIKGDIDFEYCNSVWDIKTSTQNYNKRNVEQLLAYYLIGKKTINHKWNKDLWIWNINYNSINKISFTKRNFKNICNIFWKCIVDGKYEEINDYWIIM